MCKSIFIRVGFHKFIFSRLKLSSLSLCLDIFRNFLILELFYNILFNVCRALLINMHTYSSSCIALSSRMCAFELSLTYSHSFQLYRVPALFVIIFKPFTRTLAMQSHCSHDKVENNILQFCAKTVTALPI
jgi:hypothetical protein